MHVVFHGYSTSSHSSPYLCSHAVTQGVATHRCTLLRVYNWHGCLDTIHQGKGWGCKISSHKCGGSRANYGQSKQGQPDYCWSNIELLLQHVAIIVIASWGTADLLCVTYYVSIAEGMPCECCHSDYGCCCSCFQRGTKRTAEGDEQNIFVDFSFPGKCALCSSHILCTSSCGPGTYYISDLQSNSRSCMNYSHLKLWFPLELQIFFTR